MAIRNASKAVIIKNGSILLNKYKHEDGRIYYELPGGGQNTYENLEQTVVREVKEETGYDIRVDRFVALAEEIYTDEALREKFPEYTHRIFHIFKAEIIGSERAEPTETDYEMECSKWIPLKNAEQLKENGPSYLEKILFACENGNAPCYLGTKYKD